MKQLHRLRATWELLARRALAARTPAEHQQRHPGGGGGGSGQALPKVLGPLDLTFLGLGSIIGAGVFVLSGVAAHDLAGPAVVFSYLIAAAAALLSALCYAEMSVALPVAGGAFNFVSVTFGELAAWTVAFNMCLEISLSSAAVARGFASYLATLLGMPPYALRIQAGPLIQLDPLAALVIVALTVLMAAGTRESSAFNMAVSTCNVAIILCVLAAGLPQANLANLSPLAPFGVRGVFSAASVVFFAFVGFDYVANAAEEARDPAAHLPLGIVLALLIATVLYVAMSMCIVLMVPYGSIDVDAPFSAAFIAKGMPWVARLVSLGALLGILCSTLSGLLGQSRLFVVLGRERLLPPCLASVHARTGTPVAALALTGGLAAALAFVLDIGLLAEMVSIGTLYVFITVCAGCLYMRLHAPGGGSTAALPVLLRIVAMVLASLAFSLAFTLGAPWPACLALLLACLGAALALWALPVAHTPEKFTAPFFPWTPCLGILLTVCLMCSLGWPAYLRFGIWMLLGLGIYAAYGVHGAEARDAEHRRHGTDGELQLQERHQLRPSTTGMLDTPRLASLEHEGYAAPMDGAASSSSIEMQPGDWEAERQEGVQRAAAASRGPGAGPGGGDARRLLEGHAASAAAYDPEKT